MTKKSEKLTRALVLVGPPGDESDIRYLTGFEAPDAVVCVVWRGRARLLVGDLEFGRARAVARGTEVIATRDLGEAPGAKGPPAIARLMQRLGIRRADVSARCPALRVRQLEAAGIDVRVLEGPAVPARAVKSADEIARLRRAQRAAIRAMRAAEGMLREARIGRGGRLVHDGRALTAETVRAAIGRSLMAEEADCPEAIVAGGRDAVNPHERGRGPLRAGEPIVVDIFPRRRIDRYCGDLTRTYVKGRPTARAAAMYAAVHAAQRAALALIRPGARAGDVHAAAAAELERRGFATRLAGDRREGFIHSTGHGIGLDVHEDPGLRAGSTARLRKGHVVTVEPGLYYEADGGVRIEDTVEVTADGWRYLAAMEKRFEIS
jgi:Xaa-Pro aminopeptidase